MLEPTARVLYIEDDPVNMLLVKKLLRHGGMELLEATNGWDGIETAQEHVPDLILMDMNMPDLDGYQATQRIKKMPELRHIPIIAVTANAMEGDRDRSLKAGCQGYITKPININTFVDELRGYIRHMRADMARMQTQVKAMPEVATAAALGRTA